MTLAAFVEVYRGFWPSAPAARDLEGAGFRALWAHVVEYLPDAFVLAALRHLRQTGNFAPTIAQFETACGDRAEAWARAAARRGDPDGTAWLERVLPLRCGFCTARWRDVPEGRSACEHHACDGIRRARAAELAASPAAPLVHRILHRHPEAPPALPGPRPEAPRG